MKMSLNSSTFGSGGVARAARAWAIAIVAGAAIIAPSLVDRPAAQEAAQPSSFEAAYGWKVETASGGVGVRIFEVTPGGGAATAGFEAGDVIVAVDGAVAVSAETLAATLTSRQDGDRAKLLIARSGASIEVELEIASAGNAVGGGAQAAELDAPEIVGAPQLVIDTGGHSGQVEGVVFTREGDLLITAGEDKTIRVWDWREGRTVRFIRGALGEGGKGKIFDLALSPDGKIIAAAGRFSTDPSTDGSSGPREPEHVRLISVETGEVIRTIGKIDDSVLALAYSPDGAKIATGIGTGDVQLFDAETGAELHFLRAHRGEVYSATFSPNGERLLTVGLDGSVALWDPETGEEIMFSRAHSAGVYAAAISPRGDMFATGDIEGEIRLWSLPDGKDLGTLDNMRGAVGSVIFTQESGKLVATCAGACALTQRIYDVETRKMLYELRGHTNVVLSTATHPKGRLVATAGGDNFEILIWDHETGGVISRLEGAGGAVWGVGVSPDGRMIGWGRSNIPGVYDRLKRRPIEYAFPLPVSGGFIQEPEPVEPEDVFERERRTMGELSLTSRRGGPYNLDDAVLEVFRSGEKIGAISRAANNGYDHRAFSLTPDGQYVVTGGSNGVLEKYSVTGEFIGEFRGHTTDIWDVATTPDGRLVVSASADQTVRIWSSETQELIVTIFQTSDGRWIMWTPQGYYDGSQDAGDMIGWALSRGNDRSALYVSAGQLGTILYRPKLVARALELASAEEAVAEALEQQSLLPEEDRGPDYRPLPSNVGELLEKLPPHIREIAAWKTSADGFAEITIVVRPNGSEITQLEAYVGDSEVTPEEVATPSGTEAELADGEVLMTWRIPISGGRNEILLRAVTENGKSDLIDPLIIDLPEQFTGKLDTSGRLRVLAIGVDDYPKSMFDDLNFAGADARGIAAVIGEVMAPGEAVDMMLLTNGEGDDGEPTKEAIEDALKWIAEGKDGDTTVLFIASHGDVSNGEFFILPTDFEQGGPADPGSRRVAWSTIREALTTAKGRKIVFLDACRSGASSYYDGLEGDAAAHRYVAFSSTSTDTTGAPQKAYEDPALGHGLFTFALIEGLRGGAFAPGSGRLTAFNLMSYISSKVFELSDGLQAPSLGGSGNFLLFEKRN